MVSEILVKLLISPESLSIVISSSSDIDAISKLDVRTSVIDDTLV